MRGRRLLALCLLVGLALSSPAAAEDGVPQRVLLLGPDGRALSRVWVRAMPAGDAPFTFDPSSDPGQVTTLVDGVLVHGGNAGLVVWADGAAATKLDVAAGAVGRRLAPAAPLEGRIRFDRRGPAANLSLEASPERGGRLVHRTRTDADGRYRFAYLAPGAWELVVIRGDGRRLSLGVFEAGSAEAHRAVLGPRSTVTGTVLDADASRRTGVEGIALRLIALPLDEGRAPPPDVVSDATGAFRCEDVGAGVYEAHLQTEDWAFVGATPPRVEVPDEGVLRLSAWHIRRYRRASGRVEGPLGRPVVGARLRLVPDATLEPPVGGWTGTGEVLTDAKGRFSLDRLAEATGYRLAVEASGFAPTLSEPFAVAGPAPTPIPTLRLGRGWRLEVRLRAPGGGLLAGVPVRVLPARIPASLGSDADETLGRTGITDAQGVVVLADLPTEDVRVTAGGGMHLVVEGLVPYPRSGDVRTWRATLFDAPSVQGTVEWQSEAAPRDIDLRAVPRDGAEPRQVSVAADGTFEVRGLPAVPVDLAVLRRGGSADLALARVTGVLPGSGEFVRILVPEPLRVEGRVLDAAQDGLPVRVSLEAALFDPDDEAHRWRQVASTATRVVDGTLRFAFEGLAPGVYAVRARQGDNDSGVETVHVEDVSVEGLDLVLPAPGRVAGSVLDERGLPVIGAHLRLVRLRGDGDAPAPRSTAPQRAAASDGSFVFEDVAPGLWRLEAGDRDVAADVEILRVDDGEHVFTRDLVLSGGGTLEGHIEDVDGRALDRVMLILEPLDEGTPKKEIATGEDGRFRASALRPGVWRLSVDARAGALADLEALFEIRADETTTVDLTSSGRGRIEGRVQREGRPVVDATLRLLRPAEDETTPPMRLVTRTDGDGAFGWDGLPAGRYVVDRLDAGVRAAQSVDLADGQTARVELEAYDARIPGQVVTLAGFPVPSATVRVTPTDPGSGWSGHVVTDPEGYFKVVGLPAGTYDLDVEAPGYPPGRWRAAMAEVPGAEQPVTITVGRGGTLDLQVRDDEGRAVRAARVWLEALDASFAAGPYVTAAGGRLRLLGVPPGPHLVFVHAARYGRPPAVRVAFAEGDESVLDVTVPPAARLEVTVVAERLDPVTRTRLSLLRLPGRIAVERRRPLSRTHLMPGRGSLPRSGITVIEDLGPGTYELVVDGGGRYEVQSVPIRVEAGEDSAVTVRLVPR